MPAHETFFSQQGDGRTIEVIKTYDESFASEVFHAMDAAALKQLWDALAPTSVFDTRGLPELGDPSQEAEAFLWDELREQAREEGPRTSFFVVSLKRGAVTKELFVSADYPSAEKFAMELLGKTN